MGPATSAAKEPASARPRSARGGAYRRQEGVQRLLSRAASLMLSRRSSCEGRSDSRDVATLLQQPLVEADARDDGREAWRMADGIEERLGQYFRAERHVVLGRRPLEHRQRLRGVADPEIHPR